MNLAHRIRNSFVTTDTNQAATDLGHRIRRLCSAIEIKITDLQTKPPTVAEVILGTTAERLRTIPVAGFDALVIELDAHLKEHGCSSVRVEGDDCTLSELRLQMESTAEILKPYRPIIAALK